MTDRGLWPFVRGRAACSTDRLNPDDRYPLSVPVAAARREAAAAIALYGDCLELALRNWATGQFGVWGVTVPTQREKLRTGRVTQLAHVLPRNQPAGQVPS